MTTEEAKVQEAIEYFKSLEEQYRENDIHNKFPKFLFVLPEQEQTEILEKEKVFKEQQQQKSEDDENKKL